MDLPIVLCRFITSNQIQIEERLISFFFFKKKKSCPEINDALYDLLFLTQYYMAAVALKGFIEERWAGEKPTISRETKSIVRDVIFQGLYDEQQQIRSMVASVISVMIENSDSSEWNDFFERFHVLIRHGSMVSIDGTVLTIVELMKCDNINLPDINPYLSNIIPFLFTLLENQTSERTVNKTISYL